MSFRRALLIGLLVAAGAIVVEALDRRARGDSLTEDDVRQALIRNCERVYGSGSYPEEELRTESLVVVRDREGNPVWRIDRWLVYPQSLRYKYAPTGYREQHLKTGGYFERSWFSGWEAVTDTFFSIKYPMD
jgi:hypothetical protein